ncbi:MAG: hypothetical protein KJ046_08745 [Anaerolineae bacterium]|nr:hypothetical protein [Anaerolineae bacterium]
MNEFQAILVEIIFFVLRFAVPVLIVYTTARILHHFVQKRRDEESPEVKIVK